MLEASVIVPTRNRPMYLLTALESLARQDLGSGAYEVLADDTEQTLSFLEKAIAAGYPPSAIRDTPDFDHLRDNPRVQILLKKI